MPTFRNDGSMPLNYASEGGPWVEPGEMFSHAFPSALLDSHLQSGQVSEVRPIIVDEIHEHADRALVDQLTITTRTT